MSLILIFSRALRRRRDNGRPVDGFRARGMQRVSSVDLRILSGKNTFQIVSVRYEILVPD